MVNNLKQFLKKDVKNTLIKKDESFSFNCAKECWGTCCIKENVGHLQLSIYDVYRLLKKRLDLNILDFIELKIEEKSNLPRAYIKWKENGHCPNLEEDGSCKVYAERPYTCAIFPLSSEFRIDDELNTVTIDYVLRENLCYGFLKDAKPLSRNILEFLDLQGLEKIEELEMLEVKKRDEWQKKYDLKSFTDKQLHILGQALYCLQDKVLNKNSYFMDRYSEILKIPKRKKRVENFSAEELTTLALEEFAPRFLEKFHKEKK